MVKTRIFAFFILLIAVLLGVFSNYKGFPYKLGLDLAGGTHLVYVADVSDVPAGDVGASMEALRNVVERRVNIFGVSEPLVQIEQGGVFGTDNNNQKLIVELPGVTDVEEAIASIGRTPVLDFRLMKSDVAQAIESASTTPEEKTLAYFSSFEPTGLTGRMLERAILEFNPQTGEPLVGITFNDEGKELFAKITRENIDNILGIFLDGAPISLPVVRDEIRDGKAQVSGAFALDEAKALVRDLNYGALPVPIELLSTQTVGASLGQDAVSSGVLAGVWAFALVSIFLVLWYRLPGFVAVIALFLYSTLNLALFKVIPVTLTAAGIAGFILSLGMAVDANVLIFERMKEELAKGRGLSDSMKEGFGRAWLSIRDSNISSMLTAGILFYFGSTSVVKGFALVFFIGVITSMLTAITASRVLLYAIGENASRESKIKKFLFGSGINFNKNKI